MWQQCRVLLLEECVIAFSCTYCLKKLLWSYSSVWEVRRTWRPTSLSPVFIWRARDPWAVRRSHPSPPEGRSSRKHKNNRMEKRRKRFQTGISLINDRSTPFTHPHVIPRCVAIKFIQRYVRNNHCKQSIACILFRSYAELPGFISVMNNIFKTSSLIS